MRPGHPDPWIHPATPGLPQVSCKGGEDCLMQSPRLIIAVTATQGFCASCAQKRGLKGVPASAGEAQQEIPGL